MDEERSIYVSGFNDETDEDLLEELFTQAGPVNKVLIRASTARNEEKPARFALIEFQDEVSVLFSIEIMNGVRLFNSPLVVKPRNKSKQESLYFSKRSEIENRQRSAPTTPTSQSRDRRSYDDDRNDRSRDYDRDRDRNSGSRNWRHQDSLPPPPPPPNGSWRSGHQYLTPQLLPHEQFANHMRQQSHQYSAPAAFSPPHHQQHYQTPPPRHHPYETPQRRDRQGYDRYQSRDSGRRQGRY